jgi:acetyl esterase/lipase
MITALTNMLLRRTVRRWFENDANVADTRRKLARFIGLTDRMPRGWAARAAGTAGGAALHRVAPKAGLPEDAPLIVYFHGGGYIVGGLASHAPFCARLGHAAGAAVLFVDYRLAPEHPFPAAFEDGVAAWREAIRLARGKVFIAGDSAGGGLALAVAQAAIAAGERRPDGLILLSPWLDLTLSGKSLAANAATDAMLSRKILTRMRDFYLGDREPGDRRDSPLFDANGALPPVLLIYSESEVLRDDSTRLAKKLRVAGTEVTARAFERAPHVFVLFGTLPAAGKALKEIGAFTRTA